MKNKAAKYLISLLPQKKISSLAGSAGRSRLSRWYIKHYARQFNINLEEIEKPVHEYEHLTEFFTRKLKSGARPINMERNAVVSPVDGVVSQIGKIQSGSLIQAKGITYTAADLLGDTQAAERYQNGRFVTIYLSPKDYHRIHMPLKGTVTDSTYIPGRLFPVNEIGVGHVSGLFTRNERVVTHASTPAGNMALVKVGAFIVGSVKVTYGELERKWKQHVKQNFEPVTYEKGDEIGLFEFGSTVILLFEEARFEFESSITEGTSVVMGEKIGTIKEEQAH
ncbi:archaetidylserine decarboxylase [Fictibacillus iocasae]|uniref:Phosphatidylserine decarboxylase proenzyme n=1 Tax=Fictibacillus iocasae TaxID=2715437 RepID=A0ABW2NRN7_9BACL